MRDRILLKYLKLPQRKVFLLPCRLDLFGEFLEFSQSAGNDLSTPMPEFHFPGLKPGDRWCLCVERWTEAKEAGAAPPVFLSGTHVSSLEFVDLDDLKAYAVDPDE